MTTKNLPRKPVMLELQKDTVGTPMATGHLYRTGGFWSLGTNEAISDIPLPKSPVIDWIPSRGVDFMESRVSHLSYVKPQDFTGATSYLDYLASLSADSECDYGPSSDFNGFEYAHSGHAISAQTDTMKPQDFGARYCEAQPIMRVRGDNVGVNLENDALWGLARASIQLADHLNFNVWYGDPSIARHTFDGLDTIIQPGWVQSKIIGGGQAYFSDPIVESGVALTTPQALLLRIKSIVRRLVQRMTDRGYNPTPNDMAIFMPKPMWTYIADSIANGSLMNPNVPTGWEVHITPETFFRERDRITQGFFGNGFIQVDDLSLPVITDSVLGANSTTAGGHSAVTSDIFILTRYFKGMTILEHQYFNWNAVNTYPTNGTEQIRAGGMIRSGWKMVNNKCFQHYVEMHGRIVPMMMPFQARINDVTVETESANENESISFTSPNFYPYGSVAGGSGVAMLPAVIS